MLVVMQFLEDARNKVNVVTLTLLCNLQVCVPYLIKLTKPEAELEDLHPSNSPFVAQRFCSSLSDWEYILMLLTLSKIIAILSYISVP
jgi:hypothetical protein